MEPKPRLGRRDIFTESKITRKPERKIPVKPEPKETIKPEKQKSRKKEKLEGIKVTFQIPENLFI